MPDAEQIKRLCWLAWRNGSIGSGDSVEKDQGAFKEWWEEDAKFLLANLPIKPVPNYDTGADEGNVVA